MNSGAGHVWRAPRNCRERVAGHTSDWTGAPARVAIRLGWEPFELESETSV